MVTVPVLSIVTLPAIISTRPLPRGWRERVVPELSDNGWSAMVEISVPEIWIPPSTKSVPAIEVSAKEVLLRILTA